MAAQRRPQELTLDPLVTPARILPGQADDQLLDILVQWWPTGLTMRVGPRAGDQASVPTQQRLRPDEEARPAGPGQYAAGRGKQRPVGKLELGSWDLAAQHGELVAEHQDLKVLGGFAAGEQHEQLEGAAHREVRELR
jgi:hypothetical protein